MLKPTGLTIGQKFTITLVSVSCLVAVGVGVRSYMIFASSLERSIMQAGHSHLETMHRVALDYVQSAAWLRERINSKIARIKPLDAKDPAQAAQIDEANRDIEDFREQQRLLSERFNSLLPFAEGIETSTVMFPNRDRVSLARGDVRNFTKGEIITKLADGTEISHGLRENHGILSFERNVDLGETKGTLFLQLSAEDIDAATRTIRLSVVLAVILSAVIGFLITFVLSTRITAPIRHLVDDIQTVATGDLDHRTRAASHDEVGVMARAFDVMTQGLKAAREAEVEHRARERELAIAGEIQTNLLPKEIPAIPGYDMAEYYRASKEVGGDYFDVMRLDEHRLGIVVADVSGKGVPGAMVMTMVRALLRMEATQNSSTAGILAKVNRVVNHDVKRGMFVTAMFGILDIGTRKLMLSSAGHNPLLVYRARLRRCEEHNPAGIALGFDPGPIFESRVEEEEVSLKVGDRVVMFTDGVVEAMNPDREEFGEERLREIIEDAGTCTSRELVERIVAAVTRHQGTAPQHDDITILAIKVEGSEG